MTPALRSAPPVGVWPDFIAPPKYENPCEDWEDPRLPDFRLIWETARPLGYAIGLHGSMKRDCDLIAAPWVDNPAHPDDLIKALCVALNATQVGGVEAKPVGRIAVILQIDGYVKHIDLSIMPAPPVGARVKKLVDDAEFLREAGTDAAKWAAGFKAVAERLGHDGMDEGWLIGWFANAIEASRRAAVSDELSLAAADVVAWFDLCRPDLSGPRISRLRYALAALLPAWEGE